MPVKKAGKNCYRYGSQKRYCGSGAKAKAARQGAAISLSRRRSAR